MPSGGCTCGDATHFAGATKYGAMLAYGFDLCARRVARRARSRARFRPRRARGPAGRRCRIPRREHDHRRARLARLVRLVFAAPLAFRVTEAGPVAYAASPVRGALRLPRAGGLPLAARLRGRAVRDRGAPHGARRESLRDRPPRDPGLQHVRPPRAAARSTSPSAGPPTATPLGARPRRATSRSRSFDIGGVTPRSSRVLETVRTGRPRPRADRARRALPPRLTSRWTCAPTGSRLDLPARFRPHLLPRRERDRRGRRRPSRAAKTPVISRAGAWTARRDRRRAASTRSWSCALNCAP